MTTAGSDAAANHAGGRPEQRLRRDLRPVDVRPHQQPRSSLEGGQNHDHVERRKNSGKTGLKVGTSLRVTLMTKFKAHNE